MLTEGLHRLREVAALLSPSHCLLGVVPQPTDSRLSETRETNVLHL